MKTKECVCENCKKQFLKPLKEAKRSEKLGRKFYCSRKCSGASNFKNFKDKFDRDTTRLKEYWKENNYGRDEYTDFRRFIRTSKQRKKEFDLDLEYIKSLWDLQKGICPLTSWELSLERNENLNQASLDRIDSNKGYVKGNVRFIALIANYCRNNYSDEQVREFCSAVHNNSLQAASPPK